MGYKTVFVINFSEHYVITVSYLKFSATAFFIDFRKTNSLISYYKANKLDQWHTPRKYMEILCFGINAWLLALVKLYTTMRFMQ